MPIVDAAEFSLLPSALVDVDRLAAALGADGERITLLAVAECTSTNAILRDNFQKNAGFAALCVADRQTAGRGRRGRAWSSTPEGSLTFSLAWPFRRGIDLSGLSLAVGLALRAALADCGVNDISLKWPNDLLVPAGGGLAKVGGILVEILGDAGGISAVVGVGINLRHPNLGALEQPAAGIDSVGEVPERHRLLAALVASLCRAFESFAHEGFAPLASRWDSCHAFHHREVLLHPEAGAPIPGECLGVDSDGALRVRTAVGVTRWLAGDVSLRAVEPAS